MGKLVKYCSKCEEGFAERFGFCPNCGGQLEAFEMKPIVKETEVFIPTETENFTQNVESKPPTPEFVEPAETLAYVPETVNYSSEDDILELDSVDTREEKIEKEAEFLAPTIAAVNADSNEFSTANFSQPAEDEFSQNQNWIRKDNEIDNGYHVTVVSEEASSWFKPFLLSLMGIAFAGAFASYAVAIWIHGFQIPEIDGVNEVFYSNLTDEDPLSIEEKIIKKNNDEGGGGGGGGKNNPEPVSRGRVPNQSDKPSSQLMILPVMENPSLAVRNNTEGKNKRETTDEPIGNPNSLSSKISSGGGSGGGVGNGTGTGFGNGRGTGEGNGIGSGSGNGRGNGNGNGIGDGDDGRTPTVAKIEKPSGVTKGVTITSKPTPRYTDAARQNNVQGTVTLRVTFNANGTIGGIAPVNQLPYGLTEQAIQAARQIRFEPAMRNGQPYAVTKQVQYSFTIY